MWTKHPLVLAPLLQLALLSVAAAHQMKAALTEVSFNPRSCNVEVVHRYYVHDAEHAAAQARGAAVDLSADADARRRFAEALASEFAMGLAKGETVALQFVGAELDGKFLWIYQEWLPPHRLNERLWFRHSALQSTWASQENQVNVRAAAGVRSLAFRRKDGWKSLPAEALELSEPCVPVARSSEGP